MSRKVNSKRLCINEDVVRYKLLTVSEDVRANNVDIKLVDRSLNGNMFKFKTLDDLMRIVNKINNIGLFMSYEIGYIFGCPSELASKARAFKRYIQSSFNVNKPNIALKCYKHKRITHESHKGLLSDLYPNTYSDLDCPNRFKLKYVATEVYTVVSYSFELVYKYR